MNIINGRISTQLAGREEALTSCFHNVMEREAAALCIVAQRLRQNPECIREACRIISECRSDASEGRRICVAGVGKAGLISRKVAATLSSTGTPAFFVHPVEALHGDLGGVCRKDCGLLLSYSGETPEIIRLAKELKRLRCPLIALTCRAESSLGQLVDVVIELGDLQEACELGLAPSSTTTAMVAIGDALALAVAQSHGFSARDFAINHPAGMLGLRLRQVCEFMRTGPRFVRTAPNTSLQEVVRLVTNAQTGAAVLTNEFDKLIGIFTDGDLRRAIMNGMAALDEPVHRFSTMPCAFASTGDSVADAWKDMLDRRIEDLPVVDGPTGRVIGLLCLKDIKF